MFHSSGSRPRYGCPGANPSVITRVRALLRLPSASLADIPAAFAASSSCGARSVPKQTGSVQSLRPGGRPASIQSCGPEQIGQPCLDLLVGCLREVDGNVGRDQRGSGFGHLLPVFRIHGRPEGDGRAVGRVRQAAAKADRHAREADGTYPGKFAHVPAACRKVAAERKGSNGSAAAGNGPGSERPLDQRDRQEYLRHGICPQLWAGDDESRRPQPTGVPCHP